MDIRALFAPQNSCIEVNFGFLRQIEDTVKDYSFLESLFAVDDIRYYYVLREDHAQDISLFHKYLCDQKLSYIYENKQHIPMGIFTCELRQTNNGDLNGFVAYALLPQFRGHNYIENVLKTFCLICKDSQLSNIILDICMSNEASTRIAKRSGFSDLDANGRRAGFIDPERPEMGMRLYWRFNLHQAMSERERLCRQAMQAYSQKDYYLSIRLFNQALDNECPPTCPFTDAQINANVAMSYSSVENYSQAYQCLMTAYNSGIRNDSVVKEINWLRNNVPWACM